MAVQIPDFSTLGVVNPQPGGALPVYPQTSPQAQGEETLGQGIAKAGGTLEDVAAYDQMARNRMERAMASAHFETTATDLDAQIKAETDPAKITALRGQYDTALQSAAGAIGDPGARQLWLAQNTKHALMGQKGADLKNLDLWRQNYVVGVDQQATERARAGATDPQSFVLADGDGDGSLKNLYDSLSKSGAAGPEQAYARLKAAQKQLYVGRADNLIASGDLDGARSFLGDHGGDLDAITAANLRARIEHLSDKKGALDLTNSIWGGKDTGRAGNRQSYDATGAPDQVDNWETRNNNFGGLRRVGGPVAGPNAGGFQSFDTPEAGVSAISNQLDRYASGATTGKPLTTLRQIVSTWAPPSENDTGGLIARAVKVTGFDPDQSLDLSDPGTKAKLIEATIRNEQGGKLPVNPAVIAKVAGVGETQVAAADTGTITDAPPPQSGPTMPPLPDIDSMVQRVQDMADGGKISQERANAVEAQLRSRYNHVQAAQANDRASLGKTLQNGIAMLADGRDFDYDPAQIRHFFPKDKADDIIQQLSDAKDGGQLVAGVRTASPDAIDRQRAQLDAALSDPNATDYAKRRKMVTAFDAAVQQRNNMLTGPNADPVGYLAAYDPLVQAKRDAIDPKNPQTFADYATAALSEQTRMGVPPEQQHVLSANAAGQIAGQIGADPEHAPDTMRAIAAQYGPQAWPNVWGDLITLGKLPAGYQVVGQLADYDQANAAVLARALSSKDKDFRAFAQTNYGGQKTIEQTVTGTIEKDDRVTSYERSLSDSGSSPAQVVAIRHAIRDLAIGRAMFQRDDVDTATTKAIDAVVGHYRFLPNGGARVPRDKSATIENNADAVLRGLSAENTTIPSLYGASPDQPKRQEYIDMVKAAPTWITGPRADRLLLIDSGARQVLDVRGNPVSVPFDMPALGPAPTPTQSELLSQDER